MVCIYVIMRSFHESVFTCNPVVYLYCVHDCIYMVCICCTSCSTPSTPCRIWISRICHPSKPELRERESIGSSLRSLSALDREAPRTGKRLRPPLTLPAVAVAVAVAVPAAAAAALASLNDIERRGGTWVSSGTNGNDDGLTPLRTP